MFLPSGLIAGSVRVGLPEDVLARDETALLRRVRQAAASDGRTATATSAAVKASVGILAFMEIS